MSPQFLVVPAFVVVFALVLSRVAQAWPRTLVRAAKLLGSTRALVVFWRARDSQEVARHLRAFDRRAQKTLQRALLAEGEAKERADNVRITKDACAEGWTKQQERAERLQRELATCREAIRELQAARSVDETRAESARLEAERAQAAAPAGYTPYFPPVYFPAGRCSLCGQAKPTRSPITATLSVTCPLCPERFADFMGLWKHRGAVHEHEAKGEKK